MKALLREDDLKHFVEVNFSLNLLKEYFNCESEDGLEKGTEECQAPSARKATIALNRWSPAFLTTAPAEHLRNPRDGA